MSKATAKKGTTANTKKPPVCMKTKADLIVSRLVSKLYGFGTVNKYAMSFDTEGITNYCLMSFSSVAYSQRQGGYVAMLLFWIEHLCSILGRKYSDCHIQVCSYDNVMQAISHDKIKADANGLFWEKSKEIHLKKWCTGTIEMTAMPYWAPPPLAPITDKHGRRHHQYHTIIQVKAQLVEQRKTAMKKAAKTHPLEIYEIVSSQGTTSSPGMHCGKKCDFGRSHHQIQQASSRVSKENQAEESGDDSKEY